MLRGPVPGSCAPGRCVPPPAAVAPPKVPAHYAHGSVLYPLLLAHLWHPYAISARLDLNLVHFESKPVFVMLKAQAISFYSGIEVHLTAVVMVLAAIMMPSAHQSCGIAIFVALLLHNQPIIPPPAGTHHQLLCQLITSLKSLFSSWRRLFSPSFHSCQPRHCLDPLPPTLGIPSCRQTKILLPLAMLPRQLHH